MINKIDHLGIAVHSISQAKHFYENVLGLTCEGIEEVESQQVRTAFFSAGETHIELLEPMGPESPVAKFLNKHGEGIHHIAYLSDEIEQELARAKENGYQLINEEPVTGAGGKRIAFLHPKSTNGVLTEICSKL